MEFAALDFETTGLDLRRDAVELDLPGSSQHVVIQIDVSGRGEDHVDHHTRGVRLEQPVGCRPLGVEPRFLEGVERRLGLIRPHEDVDVEGGEGAAVGRLGHSSDQEVWDPCSLDGANGPAEHLDEGRPIDRRLLEGGQDDRRRVSGIRHAASSLRRTPLRMSTPPPGGPSGRAFRSPAHG